MRHFELETLPESIIIIGGGVIGIEWASMLHDFGVKVTILEYASNIFLKKMKKFLQRCRVSFKKKVNELLQELKYFQKHYKQDILFQLMQKLMALFKQYGRKNFGLSWTRSKYI